METFGLNFVVNTLGVASLGLLSQSIGKLTGNVDKLAETSDNATFSMGRFVDVAVRGIMSMAPVILFQQAIKAGVELDGMMTQLTVAMGGNTAAAESMYYQMKEAVEWLPISAQSALQAYTQMKMQGIDALTTLGTYTTKLGDSTKQIPVTMMTLAQSIAIKSRQPFESVMYAFQAALRGNTMLLRMRLGPEGAALGRMIADGGIEGFKKLYTYMDQKKLIGLAIEQSKTFPAMITGFKDKLESLLMAIAGFASHSDSLYSRFSKAIERSYDTFKTWFDNVKQVEQLGKIIGDALMPIVWAIEKMLFWFTKLTLAIADMAIRYPALVKIAIWGPVMVALGLFSLLGMAVKVLGGMFATWLGKKVIMYLLEASGVMGYLTAGLARLSAGITAIGERAGLTGLMNAFGRVFNFALSIEESLSAIVFAILAIGYGLFKIINFTALWSGLVDGFKYAFEAGMPLYGLVQKIGAVFAEGAERINIWTEKFLGMLGMSTSMKNLWYEIGAAIGVVAGVVGGALYLAFVAIVAIMKVVYAVVKTIFNMIAAVAGFLGFTLGAGPGAIYSSDTYGKNATAAEAGGAFTGANDAMMERGRTYAMTGGSSSRTTRIDKVEVTIEDKGRVRSSEQADFWKELANQESFQPDYGPEFGGAYGN